MFLEKLKKKFIKIDLLSYYQKDDKYFILKERLKDEELIDSQKFEFSKDEFADYVKKSLINNSFTYICTLINTQNQGIVNSCSNHQYKELGIDINSVKTLCIKNEFSIFMGMYDFDNFKKENEIFQYDFLYSPYALIYHYANEKNCAYLLTFEECVVFMINKDKPTYGNIYYFKDNETDTHSPDLDLDLDDDIAVLDDIEDLDDSLEDSIEDAADLIEEENSNESALEESVDTVKEEVETIEFLQLSLKDYYENYSSDFIEKIVILNNYNISKTLASTIEKEFFIDVKTEEFDILHNMNLLAKEDIDV